MPVHIGPSGLPSKPVKALAIRADGETGKNAAKAVKVSESKLQTKHDLRKRT